MGLLILLVYIIGIVISYGYLHYDHYTTETGALGAGDKFALSLFWPFPIALHLLYFVFLYPIEYIVDRFR